MFDIAFHNAGEPTQIRTISERQAIPPRFLEQIFQDLKRAGLVTSKRGPKGGYALARDPSEISIGDIVRALEGPMTLASPPDARAGGDLKSRAITESALEELAERLQASLDRMTIAHLCERGAENGVRRTRPKRYVYSI